MEEQTEVCSLEIQLPLIQYKGNCLKETEHKEKCPCLFEPLKQAQPFVCVLYSNSKFPLLKFTDNLAY